MNGVSSLPYENGGVGNGDTTQQLDGLNGHLEEDDEEDELGGGGGSPPEPVRNGVSGMEKGGSDDEGEDEEPVPIVAPQKRR